MQAAYPAVCVIAAKRSSGKTSLVVSLTRELAGAGYRVITIKHAHGSLDVRGKDTELHGSAGAALTLAISNRGVATFEWGKKASVESVLGELFKKGAMGIAICEGFKSSPLPKIAVIASSEEGWLAENVDNVVALAASPSSYDELRQKYDKIPVYRRDDVQGLAAFVKTLAIKRLSSALPGGDCKKCGCESCGLFADAVLRGVRTLRDCKPLELKQAEVEVDGVKLQLSPYPQQVFADVVSALVGGLKGVPDDFHEVSLRVKVRRERTWA